MSTGLAKREKFNVSAIGSVETIIGPVDPIIGLSRSKVEAQFRCIACDAYLAWKDGWKMFVCSDCQYELTSAEAIHLCNAHISELQRLAEFAGKKRGWIWRLLHWFAGSKKAR